MGIYQTWNDGPDGVASNTDDTDYWDFGTNGQYPVLKLDVDGNGTVGDEADLHLQRLPLPVLLGFATRAISNLRLSPNPVTRLLYVQGHGLGDMTVTVRSIAGKVHGSYTIRNTGKVPFSGLPSGMYIVQIVSQTGIVTKQVIKSSGL